MHSTMHMYQNLKEFHYISRVNNAIKCVAGYISNGIKRGSLAI